MSVRTVRLSRKRRLLAIAVTVAGLAAVIAVVAVMNVGTRIAHGSGSGGGGCISTTGPSCTFKGNSAFADFGSVSSDGCIFTDAQVSFFSNLTRPGHVATQSVFVYISKFDQCNNVSLESVSNFDPSTGAPDFTGTLSFGNTLSSAVVNGTAPMFDWYTGAQSFTTTLHMTFTGFGPSSKYSDSQHFHAPGYVMNSRFTGTSKSAEASGTVTDETGANLAATPSLNAELQNSTGGTVQIFKQ